MNERIESIAKLDKCAMFEDQLTGESKIVRLQLLLQNSNLVNLTLTFQNAPNLREMLNDAQIFYMNPNTQVCQLLGTFPFNEEIFIEIDRRKRDRLYFKFRRMMCEGKAQESLPINRQQMVPGPRKSKERTIAEVKHYLQTWKHIYNSPQQSGIPYTLQQAAEKVGLPKKTLDDYDRQIKMAKAMNFDFQTYKNAGMGVMRNFVRSQQGIVKGEDIKKEEILEPEFFLNIGRSSR